MASFCCKLCFKDFTTYQKLLTHERNKHLHNKTIPHFYSLSQPSSEQILFYINSLIILIKKKLGFSRHAIGKKRFSIEIFPENIFVYLFKMKKSSNTVLLNININVILGVNRRKQTQANTSL